MTELPVDSEQVADPTAEEHERENHHNRNATENEGILGHRLALPALTKLEDGVRIGPPFRTSLVGNRRSHERRVPRSPLNPQREAASIVLPTATRMQNRSPRVRAGSSKSRHVTVANGYGL